MTDRTGFKWLAFINTTILFFIEGYLAYEIVNKQTIVFASIDTYFSFGEGIIILLMPIFLSIIWSIIKLRYLWIWSVLAIILFVFIAATGNVALVTPNAWPFILYVAVSYIACFIAICMDRGDRFDIDLGSGGSGGSCNCDCNCDCDSCSGMCY